VSRATFIQRKVASDIVALRAALEVVERTLPNQDMPALRHSFAVQEASNRLVNSLVRLHACALADARDGGKP
jgi:hypothetical protein